MFYIVCKKLKFLFNVDGCHTSVWSPTRVASKQGLSYHKDAPNEGIRWRDIDVHLGPSGITSLSLQGLWAGESDHSEETQTDTPAVKKIYQFLMGIYVKSVIKKLMQSLLHTCTFNFPRKKIQYEYLIHAVSISFGKS